MADKVHRIRKATMAATLALLVLEIALGAELYGEARLVLGHGLHMPAHGRAVVSAVASVLWLVIFTAAVLLNYLATYPVTARLRGLPASTGQAGRYQLRSTAVMLAPFVIWLVLRGFLNSLHGQAQLVLAPLVVIYLVGVIALGPRLLRAARRTRPVDDDVRQRLFQLAAGQHVTIKDIRCMDSGPEQAANAMIAGVLPGTRQVFITDRALRDLDPDELDAVVAHELGHAKKRHLPIKFGLVFVALVPVAALASVAVALGGHHNAALVVTVLVASLILMPVSMLLVQGIVGVRLERAADDYAAGIAGTDPLRRALEKLADANAAKRRTGRLWNIMTQHPGLEQRIDRLRAASLARSR